MFFLLFLRETNASKIETMGPPLVHGGVDPMLRVLLPCSLARKALCNGNHPSLVARFCFAKFLLGEGFCVFGVQLLPHVTETPTEKCQYKTLPNTTKSWFLNLDSLSSSSIFTFFLTLLVILPCILQSFAGNLSVLRNEVKRWGS